MIPALQVDGIVRRFGSFTAVDRVSFQVFPGEICGFIGPNGSGKTTSMRICATLDLPDDGDVHIDGLSVLEYPRQVRQRLGFMPDSYGAYANTSVHDYLDFFARAYGLTGRTRSSTIARLAEFTNLNDMLEKPTSGLSKGMKPRLCLAKTMLSDPALFILDEPAAGLDPRARIELRELVKALKGLGKAVLISSHILAELGEMCDSVVVIEEGRIRAAGKVDAITQDIQARRAQIFVRARCDAETLERALLEEPLVVGSRLDGDGVIIDYEGDDAAQAGLLAALVRRELHPVEFSPRRTDLEDVFMHLTEGKVS